ncbi:MAG: ferredoxin [Candidatus Bathyarchaeota archaeon]|nr:ferredoxin [Candidatus Bathyarchaeota archaeon]
MKYQIEVNREECISCGTCYTMDPDHFGSDSEEKSIVIGGTTNGKSTGTFDDDKKAEAQAAADSCPVSVITITEA